MTDDQKLTALLRLKRYEQPPAGYYEKLLQDIHRRQRAELLRRPLWAIGLERLQTFFSAHSMGNVSFAGSMAIVALVGLLGISTIGQGPQYAVAPPALAKMRAKPAPANLLADAPPAPRLLSLQGSPIAVIEPVEDETLGNARLIPASVSSRATATHQPRYVIDTRPVSFEATKVSFSF
jgi:hypothetical protein